MSITFLFGVSGQNMSAPEGMRKFRHQLGRFRKV